MSFKHANIFTLLYFLCLSQRIALRKAVWYILYALNDGIVQNNISDFSRGWTTLVGRDFLVVGISRSHSDTPRSVGLPRTSDRPVTETSTWQHPSLTSRGSVRSTRGLGPTMTSRGQSIGISIGMLPQTLIMSRLDQLSRLGARI